MNKLMILMAGFSLLAAAGCGEKGGSPGLLVRDYVGTSSPGDVWRWTLDYSGGTFTGVTDSGTPSVAADDKTLTGDLETLSTGFLKLTVRNVTPDDASIPEDGTAAAYGLEVPGLVFMVKPVGTGTDLIVSNAVGSCSGILTSYNWIQVGYGSTSYDVTTSDAYGTATFSGSTSSISITGTKFTVSGSSLGALSPPPAGSCVDGTIDFPGDVTGQITSAGNLMLDSGSGNGGIVGFKQDSSLTLSDLGNRTYIGLMFKNNTSDERPVRAVFTSSTAGTGNEMTNVETGALDSSTATLALTSISNGLVTGTINGQPMHAAAYKSGDVRVMFLVSTDGGSSAPYNVLLISK